MEQITALVKAVKERGATKVMIQLPEGIKVRAQEISEFLEKEGIESMVSLEPCYGACDLRDHEARLLGCDLLVHVGHSNFGVKTPFPVLYFPWFLDIDPIPALSDNLKKLEKYKKIGLITSVNHLPALEKVKQFLEKNGKQCFIGDGRHNPGQILGCDIRAALNVENNVDCFLFIGTGKFHYLGVGLKRDLPLLSLDLERMEIYETEGEKLKFLKQRIIAMELAKDSHKFGILLSSKEGQAYVSSALGIKKRLKELGKEAVIFVMDTITQDKIFFTKVDCFINCACPRISIEDRSMYKKPLIGIDEFWEVFGKGKLNIIEPLIGKSA
ncbi:MAG: diphthamide biosynthesis enzyme Dph2 [Candidatus Aenigmarchaeota archaeon]|nr:diphthamide biosynthesis enzyme Dph2 [Candidatus Aenigmarchaeota archaeon]